MYAHKRLVSVTLDIECYDDLELENLDWREVLDLQGDEKLMLASWDCWYFLCTVPRLEHFKYSFVTVVELSQIFGWVIFRVLIHNSFHKFTMFSWTLVWEMLMLRSSHLWWDRMQGNNRWNPEKLNFSWTVDLYFVYAFDHCANYGTILKCWLYPWKFIHVWRTLLRVCPVRFRLWIQGRMGKEEKFTVHQKHRLLMSFSTFDHTNPMTDNIIDRQFQDAYINEIIDGMDIKIYRIVYDNLAKLWNIL